MLNNQFIELRLLKLLLPSSLYTVKKPHYSCIIPTLKINWRPPSLSELTIMIFDMGLNNLGSEVSNYKIRG